MDYIDSESLKNEVQLEQLRMLYSGQKVAVGSGLVLALILVIFLADVVSLQVTLIWLLCLSLVAALRIWDSSRFLRDAVVARHSHQWLTRFRAGVYATATVWASACIFLFP